MNEFDQLQKSWMDQPLPSPSVKDFEALKRKITHVTRKQKVGNIVLLTTVGILVYFFFRIRAFEDLNVSIALGTMVGVLIIRVLVELYSMNHLKSISTTLKTESFKGKMESYYKGRIGTHLVLTPILIAAYCFAFWTLLPGFKASLSEGFYRYIVISSIVLLIFFPLFISFQVRKELKTLKVLKEE